jgi:hypothetical protein
MSSHPFGYKTRRRENKLSTGNKGVAPVSQNMLKKERNK